MASTRVGIREAYDATKFMLQGMTFEDFDAATKDFEVTPLYYRGECRGAMLARGPEVHACVTPPWYARQAIRVINGIIARHGYATTHTTTAAGERIINRLGFKREGNGTWVLAKQLG